MQPTFEQLQLFSEYTLRFNYRNDWSGYYEPQKTDQVSACIRFGSKVALRVRFEYQDRKGAEVVLQRITDKLNSDHTAEKLLHSLQKTVKDYRKSSVDIKKAMLHFAI